MEIFLGKTVKNDLQVWIWEENCKKLSVEQMEENDKID